MKLLSWRGAWVVLGARRTDRLDKITQEIREAGGAAHFKSLDVTDLEDVRSFAFGLETHGRIDVTINNASVMPSPSSKTSRLTSGIAGSM